MWTWTKVDDSTWYLDVKGGRIYLCELGSGAGNATGMVFVPRVSVCPHGDVGVCMSCLTLAIRDGLAGRGS